MLRSSVPITKTLDSFLFLFLAQCLGGRPRFFYLMLVLDPNSKPLFLLIQKKLLFQHEGLGLGD